MVLLWCNGVYNENWNSLTAVYGQDVLSRTVSWEFHKITQDNTYMFNARGFSVDEHNANPEFKRLADDMVHAVTPQQYHVAKGHMEIFVASYT
jgi:hypothetical protein